MVESNEIFEKVPYSQIPYIYKLIRPGDKYNFVTTLWLKKSKKEIVHVHKKNLK